MLLLQVEVQVKPMLEVAAVLGVLYQIYPD